jgi:hypothetical protein
VKIPHPENKKNYFLAGGKERIQVGNNFPEF